MCEGEGEGWTQDVWEDVAGKGQRKSSEASYATVPPAQTLPTTTTHTHRLLQELCADPSNEVLIFSGSEMAKLEETFGCLPLWLAAENGVYVRPPVRRPDLPHVSVCLIGAVCL